MGQETELIDLEMCDEDYEILRDIARREGVPVERLLNHLVDKHFAEIESSMDPVELEALLRKAEARPPRDLTQVTQDMLETLVACAKDAEIWG